ncbi:MAG TPA: SIMPL domain-containing protein [Gaiellaceae bacterium]
MIRGRAFPELFLGLLAHALAAVWIAHLFTATIHDAKHAHDTITITGSAKKPIAADLVQWDLSVEGKAPTPVAAARRAHAAATALAAFLRAAGIDRGSISAQVVQSDVEVTRIDKKHTRTTYAVRQGFDVSTRRIDVVERAATRLGTLLERGVDVAAEPLAYVSTNLEAAKLDALTAATAEARRRAGIIVGGLGGKLGGMRASSLGVYQITPRNSTEVSDYGVNDTSSRLKDVTAVVSATFAVRE